MCEGDKTIDIKKLAFHLCYLDIVIHNIRREREISVNSLDSSNKECLDIYKNTGNCPEIYIRKFCNDENKVLFKYTLIHTDTQKVISTHMQENDQNH